MNRELMNQKYGNEQEFGDLFDAIIGGTSSYRWKDGILKAEYHSRSMAELTGYTEEEYAAIVEKNAFDNFYEPDRERIATAFRNAVKNGEMEFEGSHRFHHKDGRIIWIHVYAKIEDQNEDGLLAGENQMLQKNMIQGLISDIAHQTLTPISNLKIYSELLQEQISDDLNETADTIHEQTEKLDFLIQSLVKLSRMENGIITVHPEHISVSELLKSLDAQYRSKANEKQIQLEIREMDTLAKYDLKWTSEAVGNILDNAIKYTGEGGRVAVEVQSYAMFARIDIKDTGMGISEEETPKIFTRFYRSLDVSELPGVGIGLYLAREIIQAQKGYIKVESEVGKGTIFSVYLPQ